MLKFIDKIALGGVILALCLGPGLSFAQTSSNVEARKKELERELDKIEEEIAQRQSVLDKRKLESASLERDIAILDAEIEKSQLQIQARNIEIERLSGEIYTKEETIGSLDEKLEREKASLAQLIRKTNEIDNASLVEVVLGNQNLSGFFEDLDSFTSIKSSLKESFKEIESTKGETQGQKVALEGRRSQELELRDIQALEKAKIERQEAEKQELLSDSKGLEARYQELISVQQRSAAQIRAALFSLQGSAAIPFGDALDLANIASSKTGVRPALILGVIAEESRLGEFIGTGNWKTDMHPTRDQPVFAQIMKRLGLNPDTMPVSKKPWYGWGGAMGPAQFIPSTWVLYEDRVGKLTGNVPPNPYVPRDAFMASALLLADNGANRGNRASERLAALRYFAGWGNAENPSYAFYGDEVMGLADKYQGLINQLN